MKHFQLPLEPAYPMAFQAISGSPKWQGFGSNKFRDVQNGCVSHLENRFAGSLSFESKYYERCSTSYEINKQSLPTMRDTPSMVQKLLEEEREAVKSALQAVDEQMHLKKKEVEEVHRKLMKEEPIKESFRAAFSMDFSKSTINRNNRVSSSYTPVFNLPVKIQQQKPVFLEAIYEEDQESGALSSLKNEKRSERLTRNSSAMPSRIHTAKSRCSMKVTSARPRMPEVLPPIDTTWSNVPTDGTYTGPLSYRWQRVADNYIDSDMRVRSRRRCRSRAQETRLRIGYQEEEEENDDDYSCIGVPRKRQITFGPPHSTSYSRWLSHFNDFNQF